jgi:hypothetical protein
VPGESPSFEELQRLRDQLDGVLALRLSTSTGENAESKPVKSPVPPSPIAGSIAGGASLREGGRGESSPPRNGQNDQQLALPAVTLSVVEGEKTAVDSQQETERGDPESGAAPGAQDPEWLLQKERARWVRGRMA